MTGSQESITMTKMAVAVLLVCLVIGAGITFFYMGYDKTTQRISDMQASAASATMSRLMEFDNMSGNFAPTGGGTQSVTVTVNDLPLVSNVAAVIQHADIDLAYIAVVQDTGEIDPASHEPIYLCKVFIDDGVDISVETTHTTSALANKDVGSYDLDVTSTHIRYVDAPSQTPNLQASKHLMQYSNQVCLVDVVENVGDLGINGVVITLKGAKYDGN